MIYRAIFLLGPAALVATMVPVTAVAASPPSPPAACSVVTERAGYRISWSAPDQLGGSAIVRYKVREHGYRKPVVRLDPAVRSTLWSTPLREAGSRFLVKAVNSSGVSKACKTEPSSAPPDSAEQLSTTPATSAPPAAQATSGSSAASLLPYSSGSYLKSRVDGANVAIDATRTSTFRSFMRTHPDQGGKGITWPKINVNPNWAMSYHVGRSSDPIWRLKGGNTGNSRLKLLTTQGFHMADSVASSFPDGDQDRPGVMVDPVFGYTVQFADAVPDRATRTITVSNAGILWHSSNGLDYRDPASDDARNFTSRGRLLDAMVIRRDVLDQAMARGTGLGHVLHLFFVETNTKEGFVSPMVGDESDKEGWGAEGERLRLDPSINLAARGLTGACLAVARTLQENGAYLGDNSGSSTQIKASQPGAYVGTNLATDCMKGRVSFDEFQVVASR